MKRFVYFGTPTVASDTLAVLLEHGFVPTLVVTSPDAPQGRGLVFTPSPVKVLALEHSLPIVTPITLDDTAVAEIAVHGCEYAICVAYGKIFPESLINTFPQGVLNVHYSLLPKYRGATPMEAALLAGDNISGVTIQKMVKELDAGDVVVQEQIDIALDETARELRPRLIALGAQLLVDTLPKYLAGEITPTHQDHALATRARKLKKEDGLLTIDAPALDNWHKYRAYNDTIDTYYMKDGKRFKIIQASFSNNKFVVERVIPEGRRETAYVA